MTSKIKSVIFIAAVTIFPLAVLEIGARFFSKTGTYDYVEKMALEQGLKQQKGKDEFRIFLYGESTMHGSHLYPNANIKRWIELYLGDLLGKETAQNATVINFGRIGYGSPFIAQSFIDTAVYNPDVAVFYSAHNDFVFPENRREYLVPKTWTEKSDELFKNFIKKSAFVTIVRREAVKRKLKKNPPRKAYEAEDINSWYDEMKTKVFVVEDNLINPKSEDFRKIQKGWEKHINRVVGVAKKKKMAAIFLGGVCRLKDFAPYRSVHKDDLTEKDLMRWQSLHEAAEKLFNDEVLEEAGYLYQKCLEIDSDYALTHFRLGQIYEKTFRFDEAKRHYVLAKDLDHFPSRGPSTVNDYYKRLAQTGDENIYVILTQEVFERVSLNGMIDKSLVIDHMHPTFEGAAIMALELVRTIYEKKLYPVNWQWHWEKLRSIPELRQELYLDDQFEFFNYVYTASFMGRYYKEAKNYLLAALSIKPDALLAKSHLAWVHWQLGEKEEALALYRELRIKYPDRAARFFEKHREIVELIGN